MKKPHRLVALLAVVALVLTAGCSDYDRKKYERVKVAKPISFVPVDVEPLIAPKQKYLGVAMENVPHKTMQPLDAFNKQTGKKSNLVKFYSRFNEEFDATGMKKIWDAGAIPFLEWEPHDAHNNEDKCVKDCGGLMKRIAAGNQFEMDYAFRWAIAARDSNIPIVISFAHEMNGYWYDWATGDIKNPKYMGNIKDPGLQIKAWRNVYDQFKKAGATNVIWAWTPNVRNLNISGVDLKQFYPGDAYVDWVGLVGYYTVRTDSRYFKDLFLPTMQHIRTFAKTKPFIIAETGSKYEAGKAADIQDLFKTVAGSKSIIGLLWFNYLKPEEDADYRIAKPAAVTAYRQQAARAKFGFDPVEAADPSKAKP